MKRVSFLSIAFILLCISAFAESSSTNIIVEVIEFNCSTSQKLRDKFERDMKIPLKDHSQLLAEFKSSTLPSKIVLHHEQKLLGTGVVDSIIQTSGTKFLIKTSPISESPNLIEVKIESSNPDQSFSYSGIIQIGKTQFMNNGISSGDTGTIIHFSYCKLEISG